MIKGMAPQTESNEGKVVAEVARADREGAVSRAHRPISRRLTSVEILRMGSRHRQVALSVFLTLRAPTLQERLLRHLAPSTVDSAPGASRCPAAARPRGQARPV